LIVELIVSFQGRVELSMEDRVWKDTRAKLANSVDSLGNQIRPMFRAGWLAYINQTYGANQPR
jgi:hypothetical protein